MNTTSRILGEARKVRPPTKRELTDPERRMVRFPEGEAAIATNPLDALNYAINVLKGRFPEAEPAIAKDPTWAEKYLIRFPESKLEWAMNGWLDWLDL